MSVADGVVAGPQGSVTIAEIAKVAHLRMDGLPPGVDPLLDATATYEPAISTGVYSYATHGAVVVVAELPIRPCGALTVSNRGVQGHTRRLFLPGSYYAKAAISYRHFGC